jgi:hypothetical protein
VSATSTRPPVPVRTTAAADTDRPALDLRRYRTRYRWSAPLRADRRHSGPGDARLITDRRWAPGRGSRHASVATDVEPALWRPHNPQWSRLPDGQLPLRQEQHKHGTAAGLLLVRTSRSSRLGPPAGCWIAKRTTGHARTHAGAAAKRSNDYKPENGPRRPLSSICTRAGRRPSRTPSAAPERSGVNAVDIRTRAGA